MKDRYYPSLDEIQEAEDEGLGICRACGAQQPTEPDARQYTCEECGAREVYGAAEFALQGWIA